MCYQCFLGKNRVDTCNMLQLIAVYCPKVRTLHGTEKLHRSLQFSIKIISEGKYNVILPNSRFWTTEANTETLLPNIIGCVRKSKHSSVINKCGYTALSRLTMDFWSCTVPWSISNVVENWTARCLEVSAIYFTVGMILLYQKSNM